MRARCRFRKFVGSRENVGGWGRAEASPQNTTHVNSLRKRVNTVRTLPRPKWRDRWVSVSVTSDGRWRESLDRSSCCDVNAGCDQRSTEASSRGGERTAMRIRLKQQSVRGRGSRDRQILPYLRLQPESHGPVRLSGNPKRCQAIALSENSSADRPKPRKILHPGTCRNHDATFNLNERFERFWPIFVTKPAFFELRQINRKFCKIRETW